MWCWHANRYIEQWKQSPEVDPHICCLIHFFTKTPRNQVEKGKSFQQIVLDQLGKQGRKGTSTSSILTPYIQINLGAIIDLNLKLEVMKFPEEIIGVQVPWGKERYFFKEGMVKNLYPEYIKNSYDSIITLKHPINNFLKSRQKT